MVTLPWNPDITRCQAGGGNVNVKGRGGGGGGGVMSYCISFLFHKGTSFVHLECLMEYLSSIVYKLMALFILFLFKNPAVSRDYVDNDPIPVPKHGTVSGYVCSYMAVLC